MTFFLVCLIAAAATFCGPLAVFLESGHRTVGGVMVRRTGGAR
jgi:hypothetical protein